MKFICNSKSRDVFDTSVNKKKLRNMVIRTNKVAVKSFCSKLLNMGDNKNDQMSAITQKEKDFNTPACTEQSSFSNVAQLDCSFQNICLQILVALQKQNKKLTFLMKFIDIVGKALNCETQIFREQEVRLR